MRRTTAPITLITRRNSPLCHQARRIVDHAARRYKLAVEVVDLDAEGQAAIERYKDEVPIVLIDGKRRFSRHVSATQLEQILKTRRT